LNEPRIQGHGDSAVFIPIRRSRTRDVLEGLDCLHRYAVSWLFGEILPSGMFTKNGGTILCTTVTAKGR